MSIHYRKLLLYGIVLLAPLTLTVSAGKSASAKVRRPARSVRLVKRTPARRRVVRPRRRAVKRAKARPVRRRTRRTRPSARNNYWKARLQRFAATRGYYRYPQINWNARDMGGYYAGHHNWTRRDRVIRGGNLHNISRAGVKRLRQLHVHEVIDLRAHREHEGVNTWSDPGELRPNRRNKLGVVYKDYPTNTTAQKSALMKYKRRYGEIYKYGEPFVTSHPAIRSYRNVFKQLLRNKHGAIMYHCLMGRDRTGLVSALFLSALGVNKYTIYNDFLLTNYYAPKYAYQSQCDELNHFFNTIHKHYGSVNNYLHRAIGLSNRNIRQLQRMYLVHY